MITKIQHTRKIATVILFLTLVVLFFYNTNSYPGGITGRTSTASSGCGSCHGSSSSSQVSVSVVSGSGSFTVAPNSTTTFTVTVSTTDMSKVNSGINLAVMTDQTGNPGTSIGTLTAGTGLRLANSELTHSTPANLTGGSVSWTFSWTAPASTGTYYLRVLGMTANGDGTNSAADIWNWMSVQAITVASVGSITVTSPNGGEDLCAGKNKQITWTSTGVNNVRIELSSDGGVTYPTLLVDNLSSTPPSWSWPVPANQTPGSNYRVRVLDASNYNVRGASNSSFNIHTKTGITQHPVPLELCLGSTAVFQVTAAGENLQYYWKKNGEYIPNANLPSLYLNNITYADTGYYACAVIGLCDSVSSSTATLKIKAPPSIVTQPKGDTVCIGSPAKISIEATGVALNYSWSKNGKTIPGSNTSELVFNNVTKADSGSYECVVSGACQPKVTSQPALLVVYTPVTITEMPSSTTAFAGDSAVFEVKATGTDLKYQWRKNVVIQIFMNSSRLVIHNISSADSASYDCIVSNRCGKVTSRAATLTVVKPEDPVIELGTTNVDLGTVSVGNTKDTVLAGVIKNNSKVNLIVNAINISGKDAGDFNIFGLALPVLIKPQESRTLNLEFVPSSEGAKSATINFSTNAKNVVSISLIGYAVKRADELTANSWDFGQVLIGNNPVSKNIIKNIGPNSVLIEKPIVTSYDSLNFKVLDAEKYPLTLKPADSVEANIMFTPTIAKSYRVDVIVNNNTLNILKFVIMGVGVTTDVSTNAESDDISIYPNPASDMVNIKVNDNLSVYSVQVINTFGMIISNLRLDEITLKWDLQSGGNKVSPGIYIIWIKSRSGTFSKPLIVY